MFLLDWWYSALASLGEFWTMKDPAAVRCFGGRFASRPPQGWSPLVVVDHGTRVAFP
jgi:hypothetical protein